MTDQCATEMISINTLQHLLGVTERLGLIPSAKMSNLNHNHTLERSWKQPYSIGRGDKMLIDDKATENIIISDGSVL